jgi:TonB family protein
MYDDLARSQRPSPLEWFVVNTLIPTVLMTLVLRTGLAARAAPTPQVSTQCFGALLRDYPPGSPIPDVFPILISLPPPSYPDLMRRLGLEGRVVLRALVNSRGLVERSSILALQATDAHFIEPARQALAAALFQPGRFGGRASAAWIRIVVDFDLVPVIGHARR